MKKYIYLSLANLVFVVQIPIILNLLNVQALVQSLNLVIIVPLYFMISAEIFSKKQKAPLQFVITGIMYVVLSHYFLFAKVVPLFLGVDIIMMILGMKTGGIKRKINEQTK